MVMGEKSTNKNEFRERKPTEDAPFPAQANRERDARILAAAGSILGEGLDFQATVNRVARVAIPEFADWCVLDLLNESGTIERAAIAHGDGKLDQLAQQFARRLPIDPGRTFGAPNVIRTG